MLQTRASSCLVCQVGWWSCAPTSRSAARPTVRATEPRGSEFTAATATTATRPALPPGCRLLTACCCFCLLSLIAFSNRLSCYDGSLSLFFLLQSADRRAQTGMCGYTEQDWSLKQTWVSVSCTKSGPSGGWSAEITGSDHLSSDSVGGSCDFHLCFWERTCFCGTKSSSSWCHLIRHSYLSHIWGATRWFWRWRQRKEKMSVNPLQPFHARVQVVLQFWC